MVGRVHDGVGFRPGRRQLVPRDIRPLAGDGHFARHVFGRRRSPRTVETARGSGSGGGRPRPSGAAATGTPPDEKRYFHDGKGHEQCGRGGGDCRFVRA